MSEPLVVSYGGGVNSTAMLIEMQRRGIRPDAVLFADTGGEFERTYEYVHKFSDWLEEHKMPQITTVYYDSKHGTLERECHNNATLPSIAFGFRGCSHKWKRYPMDKFLKSWPLAIETWESGAKVVRAIGIHAGESHRGKIPDDVRFHYWFPLIEWDMDQDDCRDVIKESGLDVPGKSSCWFCPAMTKLEVLKLKKEHPCLYARAVAMEKNAMESLSNVKGLGRHWSWEWLGAADEAQLKLFPEPPAMPCMCDDGGGEDRRNND